MKKFIVVLTSIILILSVGLFGYTTYKYKTYSKVSAAKKKISTIEEKKSKTEKDIKEKEEVIKQEKEKNIEKVQLLEVWKKELAKVKKSS